MNEILDKFQQKPLFKKLYKNLRAAALGFVLLLFSVFGFIGCSQERINRQIDLQYGKWQFQLRDASFSDLKRIEESPIVEKYGRIEKEAEIYWNQHKIGNLEQASKEFFDLGVYRLIEGRWPKNEGEIVISYDLAVQILKDPILNQKIPLFLKDETKEFILTGLMQTPKNIPAAVQIENKKISGGDVFFNFYSGYSNGLKQMNLSKTIQKNPGEKLKQEYKKSFFYKELFYAGAGFIFLYALIVLYKEWLFFLSRKKMIHGLYVFGFSASSMHKIYRHYLKISFWPAYILAALGILINVKTGIFVSLCLLVFQITLYINSITAIKRALAKSKKQRFTKFEKKLSVYYYSFRFLAMNRKQNILIISLISLFMTFSCLFLIQDMTLYKEREQILNRPSFTLSKNKDSSFLTLQDIKEVRNLKGVLKADTYCWMLADLSWKGFEKSFKENPDFFENFSIIKNQNSFLQTPLYIFEDDDSFIQKMQDNQDFSKEKFEKGQQVLVYMPETFEYFAISSEKEQKKINFEKDSSLKEGETIHIFGENIKNENPECIFIQDVSSIPKLKNYILSPYTLIGSKAMLDKDIPFNTVEIYLNPNEENLAAQEFIKALALKYHTNFTSLALENEQDYKYLSGQIQTICILFLLILAAGVFSCLYVFKIFKKGIKEQMEKMYSLNLSANLQKQRLSRMLLYPLEISLGVSTLLIGIGLLVFHSLNPWTEIFLAAFVSYLVTAFVFGGLWLIFKIRISKIVEQEQEKRT